MNCICGAKWCQIRDVCSLVGRSEQNGHRRYGGRVFGEQDVRWEHPFVRIDLAESLRTFTNEAILRQVWHHSFDETSVTP